MDTNTSEWLKLKLEKYRKKTKEDLSRFALLLRMRDLDFQKTPILIVKIYF